MRKKPEHHESHFQQAAVRMLRNSGIYCFSVPNGTKLKITQAKIAKAEGMTAGVSDIIVLVPNRPVFIEFKNPAGTWTQSDRQKEFQDVVEGMGFEYQIWDSWKQVEDFINKHRG